MKKTIMKMLKLFAVLAIVSVCVGCSTKEGHITIQGIYYERSDGSIMLDASSINVDYFKLYDWSGQGKDCTFRNVPYTISNLPGNEEYRCFIVAYDKYDVEIASASVNWLVVEGFATPQTVTLEIIHTHENKTDEWSYDDDQHWHEYSCRHTPIKGNHSFVSGVCSVCGYEKCNHDIDYSKYEYDSTYHWNPTTCGHDWARKYEHKFGEWFEVESSCLSAGKKYRGCLVCGYEEVIYCEEKQQHTFTDDGAYKCSICGVIGGIGPVGGYVFYDCDADNDSGNADGLISSECGWRYLEVAPEDLSNADSKYGYQFGYYRAIGDGYDDALEVGTKTAIGTGKTNTEALVYAMGDKAYSDSSYEGEYDASEKDFYAAKACIDYSITVDGVVYDDWFLPSKDELNLMYMNLYSQNLGSFSNNEYWSSSEYNGDDAWVQYFYGGKQSNPARCSHCNVRPVRAFSEHIHVWDSGVETKAPTCTEEGIKTYTCTICGQTKTEFVRKHIYTNYRCSVCGIWDKGPSGGYVFYDCDADNDSGNADGLISSECGWRYLEAAPENLSVKYPFGYYRTSSSGSNLTVGTKTAIGTGKTNTEALVKAMGETTYTSSGGTAKGIYAAKACADYSITVNGVVYDDWFLPSKDELDLMYDNLEAKYLSSFAYYFYWSSSEDSNGNAWEQNFGNGSQDDYGRNSSNYVRPVRAF